MRVVHVALPRRNQTEKAFVVRESHGVGKLSGGSGVEQDGNAGLLAGFDISSLYPFGTEVDSDNVGGMGAGAKQEHTGGDKRNAACNWIHCVCNKPHAPFDPSFNALLLCCDMRRIAHSCAQVCLPMASACARMMHG
jgi:hypothetical protein